MTAHQIIEASAATPMEVMAASPAQLMMQAAQLNMDPATIKQMMELQELHLREEARRAYVRDFALFAAERPSVSKNKQVGFDSTRGGARTQYRHETLDNLIDTVGPVMAKFGFGHSWQTVQEGSLIKVTCTLRHRLGHSESVTLQGGPDGTGNKNPIQQVASTITFLQRYTFRSVTGVATSDEHDDDGAGAGDVKTAPAVPPQLLEAAQKAASGGWENLRRHYEGLAPENRTLIDLVLGDLKQAAKAADAARKGQ